MNYATRLINAWRARTLKTRSWTMLDAWAGETVQIDGKTFFRMEDGSLKAAMSGGGAQGWEELIDTLTADGTQISNSTSEALLCPDFNIPAYYMAPGRVLRLYIAGVMSNVVTTPGTFTLRLRWGGLASGIVLLASAAQGLDTTARTNALWSADMMVVCRTAGATGTFMSSGTLRQINLLSSTAANLLPAMLGSAGTPLASGNAAVTVDTTAAKLLSVTGQFSVATSPTNCTAQIRTIEVLN